MKRNEIMATVLAAVVACSMAGCGATGAATTTDSAAAETAAAAEEGVTLEETVAEDAEDTMEEDYDLEEVDTSTNTITPYEGAYMDEAGSGFSLFLQAIDSTNGVNVSVGVSQPDGSLEYWEMSGTFDGSRVTYKDGYKMIERESEENPGEIEDEMIYEDGSGYVEISEDKKVTWVDDKEDRGNGIVFVWDEEMNQQIQEMMDMYTDDSGQNPMMNWTGPYVDTENKDFSMFVESGAEDTSDCMITVTQETGLNQVTNWYMEGALDTETMTIEYTGCRKANGKLDKSGAVISEENVYEDGTGRFVIDETNQSISWVDDKEDAGKDLSFTFSFDYSNDGFTEEIAEEVAE